MNSLRHPLVLGLGHKARQGKDESAKTILRERGNDHKIVAIALADALRKEVNDAVASIVRDDGILRRLFLTRRQRRQRALRLLCQMWGVAYDPHAVADDVYKDGKQRALLQAIGQGRRDSDSDYWLKKWKQAVLNSDADVVLTADLRYPNEIAAIKELGGVTIKFTRLGYTGLSPEAAAHISEVALDGATFDHEIVVHDGQLELLRTKALNLFDSIVKGRNA